jgi:predicted DNA-binding WGR domain protein
MYKRITRNSTFLVITIGRQQRRPGSIYRKEDFRRSAVAASRLHKLTRRKRARAIQIEVANEAWPRDTPWTEYQFHLRSLRQCSQR